MSNRAQRRSASKFQNDPRIKGYVDRFAMEMSQIFVDTIEANEQNLKDGKDVKFEFTNEQREKFRQKGKELGVFMQQTLGQINGTTISENEKNKIQINIGRKKLEN